MPSRLAVLAALLRAPARHARERPPCAADAARAGHDLHRPAGNLGRADAGREHAVLHALGFQRDRRHHHGIAAAERPLERTPRWPPFSGHWHDSEPTLSPDGQRLYFVSNRPPQPGRGAGDGVEMGEHHFPGTNLWYVARQRDGRWGAPVHVDGALNDGAMIYNPSVAANGDIYFSAHRADSGKAYQIYVVHPTATATRRPTGCELGDLAHNRMDPAIDPQGRFMLYAGNEGDALGRADIYIAFRQPDGRWGKPAAPGRRHQQRGAGERAVAGPAVRRAVRGQQPPRPGALSQARDDATRCNADSTSAQRFARSVALRHRRAAEGARLAR